MTVENYSKNPLWKILVETVHAMIMYPHHKMYIRNVILPDTPKILPEDLALKLGIPNGEVLVILNELQSETFSSKSSRLKSL